MNENFQSHDNPSSAFEACAEMMQWPRKPLSGPAKGAKSGMQKGKPGARTKPSGRNPQPRSTKMKRQAAW